MTTTQLRRLRLTLYVIAAFQFLFGAAFLAAPAAVARLLTFPVAPGWTNWLFAMMAARFLGYGVGLLAAARDPERHRTWIDTMLGIQAIDWLATIGYLVVGDVTLRQVTTASFMPFIFVVALLTYRPTAGSVGPPRSVPTETRPSRARSTGA